MKDFKIASDLPVKIHHVYVLNHSWIMTFLNRDIVWFFHVHNPLPCLYEISPNFRTIDFTTTLHSLDHFLSGGRLQNIHIQGDCLTLTIDTRGHHMATLRIALRPYKPRYHLENEKGILHQSHLEILPLQLNNELNLQNDHKQFEDAFATELVQPFKKLITNQIKLKTKKIHQYALDEQKAEKANEYQTLVETLLVDQAVDKPKLMAKFGPLLDYDHLSFGDLINACYKKIKKAKSSFIEIQQQRLSNENELTKLSSWLSWIEHPSLDHYISLKKALIHDHYFVESKVKITEVKAHSPYQIQYKNWVISYGKNQKQNDYLTFKLAKKNYVFLHLDGYPSQHLILHVTTFDIDAIRFASEFLLYLNQREDGTIVYAKVGSLKQTKILGQVIIKDRKTLFVKQSHAYDFDRIISDAIRL